MHSFQKSSCGCQNLGALTSRAHDSRSISITIERKQNASYRYEGYDTFTMDELAYLKEL